VDFVADSTESKRSQQLHMLITGVAFSGCG